MLETVSHPAELPSYAREALQALAQLMEEEDLAREITAGPVVRDNIPNLDQPIFVRASNTDPKIMTPTAMLKATANIPTPPKLPRPLPQPLDTPELQHEFETIIETSLQPDNEPPPPTTPRVELPEGLQDDLEQIIEENTLYKQSPTETSQELHPKVLVRKYNATSPPAKPAAASSAEMTAGLVPAVAPAAALLTPAPSPPPSKPFPHHLLSSYTSAGTEPSPPFPPQPPAYPIPSAIPPPPPQTGTPFVPPLPPQNPFLDHTNIEPPRPPLPQYQVKGPGLVSGPQYKTNLPPPPPKTMGHLQFAPNEPKDIPPPPPPTKPVTVPKDPRERLRALLEASGFLAERPSAPGVHTPAEGPTIQPNDGRSPWIEVFYGPGNYVPRNTDTYAYVWTDFMKPESRNEQRKWWP